MRFLFSVPRCLCGSNSSSVTENHKDTETQRGKKIKLMTHVFSFLCASVPLWFKYSTCEFGLHVCTFVA